MYKKFVPLLLIVILAALAVGLTYWRGQNQPTLSVEQPVTDVQNQVTQPQPNPDINKPPDPAPISTADWNIYRNAQLGFEFQYPSDLKFVEANDALKIESSYYQKDAKNQDRIISGYSIGVSPTRLIPDYFKNLGDYASTMESHGQIGNGVNESITVNGNQAERFIYTGRGFLNQWNIEHSEEVVYIGNQPKKVVTLRLFRLAKDQEAKSIFDQILSTFKFLN